MSHNAIHANSQEGILMSQDAPALIKGNNISSNGGSGIVTSSHNKVKDSPVTWFHKKMTTGMLCVLLT